ncbi:MAG TPA: right-handed parallel beta-helix repeat-containing protein [Pirellulales bacterium]|nr:right-handed parallel beta-helix repeat-containing protein [Pirellulales bacterium]
MLRSKFLAAGAVCFTIATASAREIYVNNASGSDLLDGAATSNVNPGQGPFQTIAKALRTAGPGDHIILANTGQPYREAVSLVGSRLSGTAYQPFTIEGNGATLDGTTPVPQNAWEWFSNDVFRFQPEGKQFQQLFLDGQPVARRPAAGNGTNEKVPALEPKQWALVEGWVYFRVEPVTLPQSYAISYAALPAGLTLYKVGNVVISNLTIQGFQLDGVYLHDVTGPCDLVGLNCRWNGRSGVNVLGVSQTQLVSCTLDGNGVHQLQLDNYSDCDLRNCQIQGDAAAQWQIGKFSKLFVNGQPLQSAPSK